MRIALLSVVLGAILLSLGACGDNYGGATKSVIPGETPNGPPPLSQPAK